MNNVHFAIPEIYGETLSYYELLRNLVNKVNDLIDNYNTVPQQIAEEVKNLDASQLFSTVLNQLIHSIATDNTKSANAVKVYKKHDLLYATFNETVNLYESLIDFTTGAETELIIGTNIREVNISELFIELRKLIGINKNNIEVVTAVSNENSEEIETMRHDITGIENKNTEHDNELSTLRTMISSPYNFKGEVTSISALPASGAVNDTYYVQDVKYKVTWTGSAWVQSSLSEADYQTELSELKSDLANINKEVVDGVYHVTTGSINATFLRYNISKGDKFKIKVNNYVVGTDFRIGTHTTDKGSGFTEKLIDLSNSASTTYEGIIEANINALFFKIYASAEDVEIIIEKQTDKSVNDSGYYSLFSSYKTKKKNDAEYYKCLFNNGDEIEVEINNPTVSSETVIGIVSEEGASGFERVIFNSKNLPVGSFKIKHNALSDYGYIKVFSAENVGLNFSKKIYESDLLSSKIGDAIVDSAEISTYGSYYEHQIHVGDFYQIHLSNIPIGCDVKIGTNSVGGSGFTETFISIQNASETEYHTNCNAKIDESAFKCWASIAGVKVTINSFLVKKAVDVTGGSTGYVVCGENVTGGKHDCCVAIGSNTLHSNTGVKNIAIGNDNMGDCTGNDNTSEGYHAMFRNTSGSYNSAIGSESQDDNTTGNFNSAIGFCSLQRNNTGSYNVAIGAYALECIYENRYDPENLKSVNNNVAVGANALGNAESGSNNNTAVGHNAMNTRKQYENCIAIGKDADCTKNNQMVLGSSAITEVVLMGNKKLVFNSDGTVTWETI